MSATSKVGMRAETVTIQHETSILASAARAFQIKHRRCASISELKHQASGLSAICLFDLKQLYPAHESNLGI